MKVITAEEKAKSCWTGLMRTGAYWLFFVIFVFAWWLTNSLTTVMHEEAHREICLKKNGTPEVTYYWTGLGGETYCSTTEGEDLHMMNEIVGYNVSSVVNSMFVVLFLWVVYDQMKRE